MNLPLDALALKTPPQPFKLYNPSTPILSRNRRSKRRKENKPLDEVLPSLNQAEPPSKKRKTA